MKDRSYCRIFRRYNFAFILPFLMVLVGLPNPALAQTTFNFGQVFIGQTIGFSNHSELHENGNRKVLKVGNRKVTDGNREVTKTELEKTHE